jgi:hypothetical protein
MKFFTLTFNCLMPSTFELHVSNFFYLHNQFPKKCFNFNNSGWHNNYIFTLPHSPTIFQHKYGECQLESWTIVEKCFHNVVITYGQLWIQDVPNFFLNDKIIVNTK